MKIGYFADGPWAHNAFKIINADPRFSIAFICVRYDSGDLVLAELAEKYNIDLLSHKKVSSNEFLESVKKYQCDIFVSMSFNQIFTRQFINATPFKTINCHAGKLPFYRGRNVLNWVLINGETDFGITVHYVDEGIDTGDIILQKVYPVRDEDDYSTLLSVAKDECATLLYDALVLLKSGNKTVIKQESIDPFGMYCVQRKIGDEIINWNQSSRDIFNFIRAISPPGPSARSILKGHEIKIHRAKMIDNAHIYKLIPGAVVGKSDNSIMVKTLDSVIELCEYEYSKSIRIGDRFK
jgi:methionyl-tRNA formyltransferase